MEKYSSDLQEELTNAYIRRPMTPGRCVMLDATFSENLSGEE